MRTTCTIAAVLASAGISHAQSLNLLPPAVPDDPSGSSAPVDDTFYQFSMIAVTPPKPRALKVHELVTIVIDESSRQSADQTLDTKKDYTLRAALKQFPSLQALFEGQLNNGDDQSGAALDVSSNQKFKGDGSYERNDRFQAKITAEIIDVKPNGNLVLEAKAEVAKNNEHTLLVLSGTCRQEDVTTSNTVLSSQLADKKLSSVDTGDVSRTATKGLIPRVLETLFAF